MRVVYLECMNMEYLCLSYLGTKIVIHLKMDSQNLPIVTSRNTVAEIIGSKYPRRGMILQSNISWI